ncbi:MAG: efflux RND transporter periplasmic adaptor subunit [Holosporales bacterium]|nr:efflux RND transporter periplasmic adaptor subunit [Holosporales bacterium]
MDENKGFEEKLNTDSDAESGSEASDPPQHDCANEEPGNRDEPRDEEPGNREEPRDAEGERSVAVVNHEHSEHEGNEIKPLEHSAAAHASSERRHSRRRSRSASGGGGGDDVGSLSFVKIGVLLAVIGGIGFSLVRVSRAPLQKFARWILTTDERSDEDHLSREISVEVERVVSTSMPKHINTIGELKANASVVIHSEINGGVQKIHFVEGSEVKKGDLLIKLNDDLYQTGVRENEAMYAAAKAEFERLEKIRAAGAGSVRELDKARADMNVYAAKLDSANAQLKRTEIRAPFDGVIGLIDISEGSYVRHEQELVTIVDQTPIKVKFGIPGKFVNDVGVGQAVELKVDAYKDRIFRGTVEAVDSYVDSATNCIALRASIPNEDGMLKAGLFASVSLIIGIQGETITIDESAIERMGEQEFVWVVERGRARRVPILTGARERGRVEVIAGLTTKHVVVTSGRGLSDGRYVRIVNMSQDDLAGIDGSGKIGDD